MKKKKGLNIFLVILGMTGIIFSMRFLIPSHEIAQVKSELDEIQIEATNKMEEVHSFFMKD
ncbi:hypothetical protein P7H62_01230 [Vagococcus carniphilus]|uniref:hypothetical protein n=1 Tax=Vagococcus carniphilus TaxID=218144 RepID=UPI00288F7D21|nr:hypothetical protein [Vagococcus carniphilus]MDT2829536.1 hypothetical protein [Vagococcus carniphilus]MDT2838995.1 hypothetical protein [Vagococcus carniphilus]MDT2853053.1 hypothetical protein [Vagococcus carniphilus]